MKRLILLSIVSLFTMQIVKAQPEITFKSIDAIYNYAEQNSAVIKNSEQQIALTNWQKKSAQIGMANFKLLSSFSLINNIKLPVTFLPAEAFGGDPGTFKEVTTGQPYIGNMTLSLQIDLINPGNWTKIRSADIDQEISASDQLIAKKNLFESISAVYFNILSLQEQIEISQQNLLISDSLYTIVHHKFSEGLVRQQDLNDVKVNQINLNGTLEQLEIMLEQQYLGLKLLCEIPEDRVIQIEDRLSYQNDFDSGLQSKNRLEYQSAFLQSQKAVSDLRNNHYSHLPSLSFVGYDAWQQNSSQSFFDADRSWIHSQYVGLKLTVPFPDVNRFLLGKNLKIKTTIAHYNAEHTKLQNDISNTQMSLDYEKAYSQFITQENIQLLKKENYRMALDQFEMEILPTDKLLIAFNDLLISQLNYSSASATLAYSKSKINLNNSIK